MNVNFTAKPINFKLGEYINKGFELLKKDFINIFVALIFCIIMSIIPFCGFLAYGNMFKYLRKINKNQPSSPGDIFSFDDFMPYFILQLVIFAGIIVLYIPMMFILPVFAAIQGEDAGFGMVILAIIYMIFFIVAIIYFSLKGFYIPAFFSLKGVTDIQTAWKASKVMTNDNLLSIFLFSILVAILSQIGLLACVIGVLITMPFTYTAHYFAYEDAMNQIDYNEISEIGITEKY